MMMGAPMQAGLLLGRAIHNLFSGNAGMVIASRQKNRRRYTCQSIKGEREVCAILEQLIADFPGIKTVTVNQITGSITVTYEQDEEYIDALFDALSHHLAGKHAVQERTIIPTRMLTVSDNINDSLRYAKKKVAGVFSHTEPVFLSRLLGIALFIYGINRIVLKGDRPAGPQLFLWGLALLMRQSHPDPRKILNQESLSEENSLKKN
jgi:hypothetical protein